MQSWNASAKRPAPAATPAAGAKLEAPAGGRTYEAMESRGPMTTIIPMAQALDDADFVLFEGVVFETEYLRVPDEDTKEDDVVLEARRGEDEISLTFAEIGDAEALGEGVFRLKSGALLRFLSQVTLH